jgi:hypothetical protein
MTTSASTEAKGVSKGGTQTHRAGEALLGDAEQVGLPGPCACGAIAAGVRASLLE